MISKAALIERIRAELAGNLDRLKQAALDAHAAATDPDAQAESKYDTRSLESSYLASGQEQQLEQLADEVRLLENFSFPEFDIDSAIGAGALIEAINGDGPAWFLLAPAGGGLELEFEDSPLTVLSPDSALYGKFLGHHVGDSIDSPSLTITEVR